MSRQYSKTWSIDAGSTAAALAGRLLTVSRLVFDTLHLLDDISVSAERCDDVIWDAVPNRDAVLREHLSNDPALRGEIIDV